MAETKEKCDYCHGSGRSPFSSSNSDSPFVGKCYLCKGSGYIVKPETPMTPPDLQARLLAKVDEFIAEVTRFIESKKNDSHYKKAIGDWRATLMLFRALRKAVERHGAEEYQLPAKFRGGEKGEMDTFTRCSTCRISFPCPELTEIAKEMGI